MYINIAVLKETQPHERRVALVRLGRGQLVKLGGKLHMQTGAADGIKLADAAFENVVFLDDPRHLVREADVVLDAVNPSARTDKASPIFGMPIHDADKAKKVYVVERGEGKGKRYAGIVNPLFYGDNCDMVYGDAQAVLVKMIEAVRGLGSAKAAA